MVCGQGPPVPKTAKSREHRPERASFERQEAAVERALSLGLDELDVAVIVAEHAHKLGGHND